MKFYTLLLPLSLAAAAAACSSSSDDGSPDYTCKAYEVPAGTDLTTPQVSFAADVTPIFKACTFTSCHGVGTGNGIIFAGDPSTVRAALVGATPPEIGSMVFVQPGDYTQSYLMHKIDGDQCLFNAQCTGGNCGTSMPQGQSLLSVEDRDKLRRWIAQGAADN